MLQNVSRALESGCQRIVAEAVPGAGKSHLLRELSRRHDTLILAYNAFLAAETSRALEEAGDDATIITCVTFHALCGRHIGAARDDFQLQERVESVENGSVRVDGVPRYERVLIDEAQDVRPLYVRLLRVLGLLRPDTTILVVGDRLQLVYDFDDDFPACLDVLTNPPRAIHPGVWTRVVTNETRRLTRPMCAVVNAMFRTKIFTEREGPLVEVRCPRSAFGLDAILADLTDPYLLLVDRRRGNAPLREFLNALSRRGVGVHVHGVDAREVDGEQVRCATFWSAKGVQASTVVVLLPGSAARNPTYVALTRATHRLVVVLDPKDPHAAFCEYVASHPSHFHVGDAKAAQAVQSGCRGDATVSLQQRPRVARRVVALDTCVPRTSAVMAACDIGAHELANVASEEDAANAMVVSQMARTWAECRATGVCRAVEGILQPTRMDPSTRDAAIESGFVGRCISPYQPDVISPDLVAPTRTAYNALQGDTDARDAWTPLFRASTAALTWDAFEYIMRRNAVPPVDTYVERVEWATRVLEDDVAFDVRLVQKGVDAWRTFHVRVHGTSPLRAYHVEWGASSTEIGMAAVRALLHPRRVCRLLVLHTMTTIDVTVTDPAALWEAILSERG